MARELRIRQAEFPYHVTTKVANGEFRFKSKKLQKKIWAIYARVVLKASQLYKVEVNHLVVMDNHHHVYLKTPRSNINLFMQYFNARIAEQMNKLLDRTGPFWNGRYHATILTSEKQQARVVKYMYNNPVKANIADTALDFQRSTVHFYAFGRPIFVDVTPDQAYVSLGETEEERQVRFVKEFLQISLSDKDIEEIEDSLKSTVLGNDEVKKQLIEYSRSVTKKTAKTRN